MQDPKAGLSNEDIQKLAKKAGVNQPVMSVKVVGDRVELHLLGGMVVPLQHGPAHTQANSGKVQHILEPLTVPQLKKLAEEAGLTGYSKANKAALIVLLSKHFTAEELEKIVPS